MVKEKLPTNLIGKKFTIIDCPSPNMVNHMDVEHEIKSVAWNTTTKNGKVVDKVGDAIVEYNFYSHLWPYTNNWIKLSNIRIINE